MMQSNLNCANNLEDANVLSRLNKLYPCVAISIAALFLIYKYILQVYPSIMTNELMRSFHVHAAGLGNLAATFFYAYFVTQLFVGILLDKFSIRFLSATAIFVCGIGAYLFSITDNIWLAAMARAMMGCGTAFATVSYMKIAADWFRPNQFAFIGGLLATAAMAGAVFGEAPLAMVVNHMGWRHSLLICALLGFVIASLFALVMREPKQIHSFFKKHKPRISLNDILFIFKNKQNWLLTFYSGLAFSPVAVFGGLWGNPFLEQAHHLSRTQSASFISLVFIGLAFGGPVLGYVSDKLKNRKKVMTFGVLLALVSISSVIYVSMLPLWLTMALLFLFGFGTGAFMLGFAVGKEANKAALAATVIALINSGDAIFGAVTEPMIGKLLDHGWNGVIRNHVPYFSLSDFHYAFLLLPCYLIMALLLLVFIQE